MLFLVEVVIVSVAGKHDNNDVALGRQHAYFDRNPCIMLTFGWLSCHCFIFVGQGKPKFWLLVVVLVVVVESSCCFISSM